MALADIERQPATVAQLRAAVSGGRLHHAFLIPGLPGEGVPEVAAHLAGALLCPNNPEGCGTCSACDWARRGLHPDLLSTQLDREGGAKEVKVEAVRALCASLQLAPSEGHRKVAVLADAGRMSVSAQNALLKTLEEPPPRTVLILACEEEDRLLPTIRSRCIRVRLQPLPRSVPTSARGDQLFLLVKTLLSERGKPAAALAAIELAELSEGGRERALETVELVAAFLRDLLVVQAGQRAPTAGAAPKLIGGTGRLAEMAELGKRLSPSEILVGFDALAMAWQALDGNGSARLQLEGAALRLGGLAT